MIWVYIQLNRVQSQPLGAQVLGKIAAELAYGEGLQAHAWAVEMRLKQP